MEGKCCSKCGEFKTLSEYNTRKDSKDGYRADCKECKKKYNKEYGELNKITISNKKKDYYELNKNQKKDYYELNKEKIKEVKKKYYKFNIEKLKEYREDNKEYYKEYREKNKEKIKENMKGYQKSRLENDNLFKITRNIRDLLTKSIKKFNYTKKSRTHEILGCSFEEFKLYLESQF